MTYRLERQSILRANTALLLSFVGGGLAICAVGAIIYDIGRMMGVW
jgi:hypothetical protein